MLAKIHFKKRNRETWHRHFCLLSCFLKSKCVVILQHWACNTACSLQGALAGPQTLNKSKNNDFPPLPLWGSVSCSWWDAAAIHHLINLQHVCVWVCVCERECVRGFLAHKNTQCIHQIFGFSHGNQETQSLHIPLPVCMCVGEYWRASRCSSASSLATGRWECGGEGSCCRGVDKLGSAAFPAHNNSASKIAPQTTLKACICAPPLAPIKA